MKIRFVYNPHSGKNRRRPWLLDELRNQGRHSGIEASVAVTEGPGHATELARKALQDGCTHVVAVGGDGTMNETAQALVGKDAALGLVPCGSGNGLAIHLGIPTEPKRALELLLSPRSRVASIDTGIADGHVFCNAMGVGLDAEISERFNKLKRRGLLAYIRMTAGAFFRHRPLELRIRANGHPPLSAKTMIAAVANSDQYGNKAFIAPRASVSDGRLDLVLVRPIGLLGAAPAVFRLFDGSFDRCKGVTRLADSSFVIERERPGPLHTDGETHQAGTRIEIRVVPRSLRIVVPSDSPAR